MNDIAKAREAQERERADAATIPEAEFYVGDTVLADDAETGAVVRGQICHMDLSDTNPTVVVWDGEVNRFVDPNSCRYETDAQGFWYKHDPKHATIMIGRNDRLLTNMAWLKTKGATLLNQSLNPRKRSRRK